MFLKHRATVQSNSLKDKEPNRPRAPRSTPDRAARGGGVMAFAATFTAVTWIGGGVLLHGLVQDLRAEQARLASIANTCPAAPLIAQSPTDAIVGMSHTPTSTSQTAPRQGRSPLFAQVFED